ncbi:GDSL-type esterase/lipase family protein [Jiulongibacter sediminis]|nr:GDSL-type esterase/lipase family protein [Jiulongibacter sediminis]
MVKRISTGLMEDEFREEVTALAAQKLKNHTENPIVFYGSSSFRLWETLQQDIPELTCLNLAFGGSQIIHCIKYYEELLGKTQPQKIMFYCGDNDIAEDIAPEEILMRFQSFLEKVDRQFPEVPLTFLSIKPSPIRAEKLDVIQRTNQLTEAFLRDKPLRYFLDIHNPMLENTAVRPELFTEDELHMNEQGYSIWASIVREHLGLEAPDLVENN